MAQNIKVWVGKWPSSFWRVSRAALACMWLVVEHMVTKVAKMKPKTSCCTLEVCVWGDTSRGIIDHFPGPKYERAMRGTRHEPASVSSRGHLLADLTTNIIARETPLGFILAVTRFLERETCWLAMLAQSTETQGGARLSLGVAGGATLFKTHPKVSTRSPLRIIAM